jgi:hypothetical protein
MPCRDIRYSLFSQPAVNKELCELARVLRKACSLPYKGSNAVMHTMETTKLSDKEHPWLISDDNVWKWGLHQRIPRGLIARLRRLLQQNIVADRR